MIPVGKSILQSVWAEKEIVYGHIHSERQCRYVRPLQIGLLDEKEAKNAAAELNRFVIDNGYHLNTGFLTTGQLCLVLADYEYIETPDRKAVCTHGSGGKRGVYAGKGERTCLHPPEDQSDL